MHLERLQDALSDKVIKLLSTPDLNQPTKHVHADAIPPFCARLNKQQAVG